MLWKKELYTLSGNVCLTRNMCHFEGQDHCCLATVIPTFFCRPTIRILQNCSRSS